MEYKDLQRIAKETISYIKTVIKPNMNLLDIRHLCEEKMLSLGADSFWHALIHKILLNFSLFTATQILTAEAFAKTVFLYTKTETPHSVSV